MRFSYQRKIRVKITRVCESYFENISSIIGEIPKELNGVLYRNGPNPQFPDPNKHWFEGDGMLHMFSISNKKISYRNRWIMTEVFKLERQAGKMLIRGFYNTEFVVYSAKIN